MIEFETEYYVLTSQHWEVYDFKNISSMQLCVKNVTYKKSIKTCAPQAVFLFNEFL